MKTKHKNMLGTLLACMLFLPTSGQAKATPHIGTSTIQTNETVTLELTKPEFYFGDSFIYYSKNSSIAACRQLTAPESEYVELQVTGIAPGTVYIVAASTENGESETYHRVIVGNKAPEYRMVPCYMYYNARFVNHYYTTDKSLEDDLAIWGYKYIGIAYYVYQRVENE